MANGIRSGSWEAFVAKARRRKGTLKGGTYVKSAEGNRTFGKSVHGTEPLRIMRSIRTSKLTARRRADP